MPTKNKVALDHFKIVDARAAQGRAVARAIDHATAIPFAITISPCRSGDVPLTLLPKQLPLVQIRTSCSLSIAPLAIAAQCDPSAVSKDSAKLVKPGLVSLVEEKMPGTGSGRSCN